jgi:hypothetical protein
VLVCFGRVLDALLLNSTAACRLLGAGAQGSSGSQVVAGTFRFHKLGMFAWLAAAVRQGPWPPASVVVCVCV